MVRYILIGLKIVSCLGEVVSRNVSRYTYVRLRVLLVVLSGINYQKEKIERTEIMTVHEKSNFHQLHFT